MTSRGKVRLIFIDLLRGWATLVMIEVHVFNAFIVPAIKETAWFSVLNFINGLVAPSFLFVAGFVFVIASQRKLEDFRTFGSAFWRQLGRIGLIWVIGYALHLPTFSLTRTLQETTASGWLQFCQSDILHCIGAGLMVVFLGRIFIKRDRVYEMFLLAVAVLAVLVAPLIWDINFLTQIPAPMAAYLNGQHYSLFPLFPWLGFLAFGALTATAYSRSRAVEQEARFLKRTTVVATSLILVGAILFELPIRIPGYSTDIQPNPLFFAMRLGIVLTLMLVCWFYADRRKTERSFVLDVSRESLLVYAAHLVVIYGKYWNGRGLADWYGGTLGVLQCILATLGLVLVMILFSRFWGKLKRDRPTYARAAFIAFCLGFVALFAIL